MKESCIKLVLKNKRQERDVMNNDENDMLKRRSITLELTNEECEDLSIKAGSVGLTVGELLQNFISDLTNGDRSNGSDEMKYANSWFQRCMFGFGKYPFLRFLLETYGGDEPEYYLKTLDDMEFVQKEIEDEKEKIAHPKEDEWKNVVHSDGSPVFSNIEEYLEEERACLSSYEDDFACYKKEVDDRWNEYLNYIQNARILVRGTPDRQEEVKKMLLWYREQQAIMGIEADQSEKSEQKNKLVEQPELSL